MIIKTELTHLEFDILNRILDNKIDGVKSSSMADPTVAYIAYVWEGRLEFGPCRWGYKNNYGTDDGMVDSWSISPFPGAWVMIPITKIVRVRHVEAM